MSDFRCFFGHELRVGIEITDGTKKTISANYFGIPINKVDSAHIMRSKRIIKSQLLFHDEIIHHKAVPDIHNNSFYFPEIHFFISRYGMGIVLIDSE